MATTAAAATLVLLFVSLLPLGALCSRAGPSSHRSHTKHSPPPSSPPPPAPAAPQAAALGLVRATCNSTAYYDICVAALAADPSSTTADVRGLSAIAVSAAATNASASAAAAAALANATGTAQEPAADVTVQALLRTCAAKYADARDALGLARDSIAQQDYDYASVHVSAAAEYPKVCKTLFRRQRPGAYPVELAQREEALEQLCSVALGIISLLSSSS